MEFHTLTVRWDQDHRRWAAKLSGRPQFGWGAVTQWIADGQWQVLAVVPEAHSLSAMGTEQWVDRYRLFLQRSVLPAALLRENDIGRSASHDAAEALPALAVH